MSPAGGYTTLVEAATVAAHLGEADWCLIDCRHDLADLEAGRRAYAEHHVPGAHFLHLDEDLSGPRTGLNGRHPLPDPEVLAARLRALGIHEGTQVVAYDAAGGMFAARLWWLLRWLGHTRVAVLDGGYPAWQAAGYPVSSDVPAVTSNATSRAFVAHVQPDMTVNAASLEQLLSAPTPAVQLLDARSPDRYRGENETLDPVGGHIPGALNHFFRLNLGADGRFLPAEQLRAQFAHILGGTSANALVHQCGSGVTACHNVLAMTHAGLAAGRLYPGSWSEWCADPSRPMVRGATDSASA